MNDLIANEPQIRLFAFFSILAIMIVWQVVKPRRAYQKPLQEKAKRWTSHALMMVVSTLLIRLTLPFSAAAFALYIADNNLALFGFSLPLIIGVILLDCLIYWQHRIFHKVPILWRLHRVHHSDETLDVTSAIRFHPIEIFLSMLIKFVAIWMFGLSAATVIIFEIILNGMAMFNHSNARIPADNILRLIFVTPDMHRVHHSVYGNETNSNYGFNMSIWDRIFASYIAQPKDGHDAMTIGLKEYPGGESGLKGLLEMPFKR
ncbi:sterol desaturase family protein [Cocleimonas flava]|uniref:Sterol desaturase/sphingolipid hydroxylase (Fatty acid hydroxylase superfamily) n=1 Tax=Cocleimonas flava TaxID=634765 RepID=A0A4V2P8U4_9GAMM|nr:sterol desaturase family protein [Cocleimonas flava]TCJ87055.1 sterol desaturase/sphingolipid hydroxylase (fatty acid hydroxylase superfamily) [Cocleimonas flava]